MFFKLPVIFSTQDKVIRPYSFQIKGQNSVGKIELVKDSKLIDTEAARSVLVESFICEYEKYLKPEDISEGLTSWRDGDKSVKRYYEDYFNTELKEFSEGHLDYWLQATIDGKLVGWATFQREKSDRNSVYMNLLVVDPHFQNMGIGKQLVYALVNLRVISNLTAIHLLLRKKNNGGKIFYSKLGFYFDPDYKRDNFVDVNLLEGMTWRKPSLLHKMGNYTCFGCRPKISPIK